MKFVIIALMFSPLISFAGVTNGGGGGAVVCRDQNQQIKSVQLLDLFEAEAQYGLKLSPTSGDLETALKAIIDRMDFLTAHPRNPLPSQDLFVRSAFSSFRFLPSGVALKPIDDANEVVIPTGCTIEQVANFKEMHLILINTDLWDKMDTQNKAALIIHETIYLSERSFGATDSQDARKKVGYLFSEVALEPVFGPILADGEMIKCETEDRKNIFYFTHESQNLKWSANIYFEKLGGQSLYSAVRMPFDFKEYVDYLTGDKEALTDLGFVSGILTSKIPPRILSTAFVTIKKAPKDDQENYADLTMNVSGISGWPRDERDYAKTNCFYEVYKGKTAKRFPMKSKPEDRRIN